ncbi:MAG: putative copper-exporting P-type ATPase B [Parcubacteria group bacterium Gr01-1014_38]|nr:MAG: putative copper-exporting P-type ATPase B [Parcubacteria group bacterium Gr01-1014_38]
MHQEVRQDVPGRCPECGMKLVTAKERATAKHRDHHAAEAGPGKHAGHSLAMFARKFWVSLVLTIPVVLTSELAARILRVDLSAVPGVKLGAALLASIVFFYGGRVFLVGARREIEGRSPGMMTLIAIAILTAYVYSVAVTLTGRGEPLFWELTTLITVMLLGHWLEMRAVQGAQGALKELSKLLPDTAEVLRDGKTETVSLHQLRVEDRVLVRPGGKIPADGEVTDGTSDVNEALVTGESKPVPKRVGDAVIAGTANGDGALKVRVTKIGEHTFLAGVMRLVAEAQASKSRLQVLSDKAAFALTVIAVAAGLVTLVSWVAARGGVAFALERTVAVLVIACPHALGLAVPLVASISTTLAARSGLLVRQRLALETARTIDTVLFDKTGTLTKGEFGVEKVWAFQETSERDVLQLAASVDAHSEHVVAKAIVAEAQRRALALLDAANVTAIPGQGAKGTVGGQTVVVGGSGLLTGGERVPPEVEREVHAEQAKGRSLVFVRRGETLVGAIALGDVIREESRAAVRDLRALGIRVAMVTGDSEDVAVWVARELGVDEVFARVLPAGKTEKVKQLQQQGRRVAFVGDGVNDAPALTQADVGIAIGTGTNVAIESAGILLVRNDPRDVTKILHLSRATYRKMLENLFWATGYNVIALPLAAGVLAQQGILLQPAVSALLMSLSTVIVALNAVQLRRLKLV